MKVQRSSRKTEIVERVTFAWTPDDALEVEVAHTVNNSRVYEPHIVTSATVAYFWDVVDGAWKWTARVFAHRPGQWTAGGQPGRLIHPRLLRAAAWPEAVLDAFEANRPADYLSIISRTIDADPSAPLPRGKKKPKPGRGAGGIAMRGDSVAVGTTSQISPISGGALGEAVIVSTVESLGGPVRVNLSPELSSVLRGGVASSLGGMLR